MLFHFFFFCHFVFRRPSPTRFSIVSKAMVREIVKLFKFGSCRLDISTTGLYLSQKRKRPRYFKEDWKGKLMLSNSKDAKVNVWSSFPNTVKFSMLYHCSVQQTARYEMSCKFVEITVKTASQVKVKCLRYQTKVTMGYCGRGLWWLLWKMSPVKS